jgi:hypothetical protein
LLTVLQSLSKYLEENHFMHNKITQNPIYI